MVSSPSLSHPQLSRHSPFRACTWSLSVSLSLFSTTTWLLLSFSLVLSLCVIFLLISHSPSLSFFSCAPNAICSLLTIFLLRPQNGTSGTWTGLISGRESTSCRDRHDDIEARARVPRELPFDSCTYRSLRDLYPTEDCLITLVCDRSCANQALLLPSSVAIYRVI